MHDDGVVYQRNRFPFLPGASLKSIVTVAIRVLDQNDEYCSVVLQVPAQQRYSSTKPNKRLLCGADDLTSGPPSATAMKKRALCDGIF